MKSLERKVAVITGAGGEVGRATALALAGRGARIVLADPDGTSVRSVAAEIVMRGGRAVATRCDVATDTAFETLRDFALDRFGQVDVVMTGAGVQTSGRPERITVEEWQRVLNISLLSVVRSNAAFLPLLMEQEHGHLVTAVSFAGLYAGYHDRLPYAASTAALVEIAEGLQVYLRPHGVGVTVLCLGPVQANIMAIRGTSGTPADTSGPGDGLPAVQPGVVGEQVAEAILHDTFMLYTHPAFRDVLLERVRDRNRS